MCTNENETTLIETRKEKQTQKFLLQVTSIITENENVDDPKVKEAVRQLKDIKVYLEGNLQEKKGIPRNWVAIGDYLLVAARWIKIIYDLIQQ
jgi:hypothetical protein